MADAKKAVKKTSKLKTAAATTEDSPTVKKAAKSKTATKKPATTTPVGDSGPTTDDTGKHAGKDEAGSTAKVTAKAGKRSAKSLKEAEVRAAKVRRKADNNEAGASGAVQTAKKVRPARSRLERRGKKFREAAKLIDPARTYPLNEALPLAINSSPVKFDATVELHVNLAVDPRQSDQNIRGTLVLPSGTGKTVRVAVFSDDSITGADVSGIEAISKLLDKGDMPFDVLIASPAHMAKLGKYARLLGPRGLMPNPKSGTVTNELQKAVTEAKAGRIEYRVDSTGIVHVAVGKVSFTQEDLLANVEAVIGSLRSNKPASIKGSYIKTIHLATTMGPSIAVSV